jgi:hypothetical protein
LYNKYLTNSCNEKAKEIDQQAKELFDVSLDLHVEEKYSPYPDSKTRPLWTKPFTGFTPKDIKLVDDKNIPKNAEELIKLSKEDEERRKHRLSEMYNQRERDLDKLNEEVERIKKVERLKDYFKRTGADVPESLRPLLKTGGGKHKKSRKHKLHHRQLKKKHRTRKV